MGLVLDDNNKGVHVENKPKSFVIFSDYDDKKIEFYREQLDEAIFLLTELKKDLYYQGFSTDATASKIQDMLTRNDLPPKPVSGNIVLTDQDFIRHLERGIRDFKSSRGLVMKDGNYSLKEENER